MGLDAQTLLTTLARLGREAQAPIPKRYCIAFSGGMDSCVLLHALARARQVTNAPISLQVFHVDHGLSPLSRKWAEECENSAKDLGLPFQGFRVDARPAPGESPEAAARRARYQALVGALDEGDWLLTAHHQDDQAETLLLQLLRGAGPRGLGAMPSVALFGRGWLARPLLAYRRDALLSYARRHGLTWVEDESNFDTGFSRNFVRHAVMPRLLERWPSAAATLARSADLCGEAAHLLEQLADIDLAAAATDRPDVLRVTALLALGRSRLRNALAIWFRRLALPVPARVHIERIINEVLGARQDATPRVAWSGAEARRYRDRLYAMAPLSPPPDDLEFTCDLCQPLAIPGVGTLSAAPVRGAGLRANGSVIVRFRRGGERCRPVGRGGNSHALKNLFQEIGVPPWQRGQLPLLFRGDQLAAVPGYFLCEPHHADEDELGWRVQWTEPRGNCVSVIE